jgi:hypothetical protein
VGEETVILNLESGTYFGLDPIGTRYLDLLEAYASLGSVLPVMLREFEVTEEQLESDLARLTEEMLAGGLLERE